MNDQQIVAVLKMAMDMIKDAAKAAGPIGAPSGVVYAAFSAQGMTLNVYQQILAAMEKAGQIRVSNHLITVIE